MALLDIVVKTLDGQNRKFSVPEQMTVKNFKEKISNSIKISANTQRLIFHGRVMQDDKELREYDIHGKAVHVVQRAPPSSSNTDGGTSAPNPPRAQAPNLDENLVDVQIHFGGMNPTATSREARQRIQQARVNIGIVNDALNLLEQRTGASGPQAPSGGATPSSRGHDRGAQERMDTSTGQGTTTGNQNQDSQRGLTAGELADFLDRVLVTNQRITPHIANYQHYLRNEEAYIASSQAGRDAQEVANRVMEAIHAMSHVMHSLSDVIVDMQTNVPRQATAAPVSPFAMTGGNTMAIPIHMNVRARPPGPTATGANHGRGRGVPPPAPPPPPSMPFQRTDTVPPTNPIVLPPPQATMEGVQINDPLMTVHNIQTTVVSDDVVMEQGMQFNVGGGSPANASISISSSAGGNPSAGAPTTGSSMAATSTISTGASTVANNITTTSSARTGVPNPTAGFSVGPTTNVNVGGMPPLGQLPNVPGLPGGMLQNIVQSILNNHGVQPGQPVHVNVLHPTIHVPLARPQGPSVPPSQNRSPPDNNNSGTNTSDNNPVSTASTSTSTRSSTNTGTGSRSATTPRPIFINRGGRPAPYPSVPFSMGPRQAHPRPGGPGGPGNGGPHSHRFVDMFLPCSSHHYNSQSARRAARTSRNQGQQQVPNLSTMVSGVMGDWFGHVGPVHHHVRPTGNRPATPSANSSTPNTSASTTSTSGNIQGGVNPGAFNPNPAQMLANLMAGGPGLGMGAPGGPDGGAIHLDLTSLISSMMGGSPNAAPPDNNSTNPPNAGSTSTTTSNTPQAAPEAVPNLMGDTLADMFRQFASHMGSGNDDQTEPSFFQSLLETVAPHIRLPDLFSLVMGNTHVVGQLRDPLRQFVQGSVTQTGSVENTVDSAVNDMDTEIVFIAGCVEIRPNVDMPQSIRNCLKYHLKKILDAVLSDTPASQEDYGQQLYDLWMVMLAEMVALCVYCIRDGQPGFTSMLQQYMPRMTRDLNPGITFWLSNSVQDILSSFYQNHPVPEATILRFVTQSTESASAPAQHECNTEAAATGRGDNPLAEAVSDKTATQANNGRDDEVAISAAVEDRLDASLNSMAMDVTDSPCAQSPKAKIPRTHQTKDTDSGDEFVDAPEEFTSRPNAAIATRPTQIATSSTVSKVTGGMKNGAASSQWQNVIPQEWIPVIDKDIEKQKEQRSQPPLSDAYLQGLPAKRRRMMVLEHAGEIGNMPQYLPSAITRAARVAGVEPISSRQNLLQEASEERELHEELEQEIQDSVESRITTDSDFNSDRFPNSIRYFKKPKKP